MDVQSHGTTYEWAEYDNGPIDSWPFSKKEPIAYGNFSYNGETVKVCCEFTGLTGIRYSVTAEDGTRKEYEHMIGEFGGVQNGFKSIYDIEGLTVDGMDTILSGIATQYFLGVRGLDDKLELREELEGYAHDLYKAGHISWERFCTVLDHFDEWSRDAAAGDTFVYDGREFTLCGTNNEKEDECQ